MKKIILILFLSLSFLSYSQNTWNPHLYDTVNGDIYTYNVNMSYYYTDGRICHFDAVIVSINTTGVPAGFLALEGLPGDIVGQTGATIYLFKSDNINYSSIVGRVSNINNPPIIYFYRKEMPDNDSYVAVTGAQFTNGQIRISGFYFIR